MTDFVGERESIEDRVYESRVALLDPRDLRLVYTPVSFVHQSHSVTSTLVLTVYS